MLSLKTFYVAGKILFTLTETHTGWSYEYVNVVSPLHLFECFTLFTLFSALQIFKSELHPSVYKLQSGEKEGMSLYGKTLYSVGCLH